MNLIVLNNIKEIRKELNLTTRELAKLSELSNSTITSVENGRSNPNHTTMLLLCRWLNRKFEDVFETNPDILDAYFGRNTDHS